MIHITPRVVSYDIVDGTTIRNKASMTNKYMNTRVKFNDNR